jgi:hypothetical protein
MTHTGRCRYQCNATHCDGVQDPATICRWYCLDPDQPWPNRARFRLPYVLGICAKGSSSSVLAMAVDIAVGV